MSQTVFFNWSGGMESSAMLAIEAERIHSLDAQVIFADTGKQFPELYESKRQIESNLGIEIVTVPRRITFEEFLFERGGMIRKGTTDCSRRMKRTNLGRYMKTFARPYEVNLGYNAKEKRRAEDFSDRNERDWLHWRFPLIERGISREQTWDICRRVGFDIVVAMYEKMDGRMDCFWCGNQTPAQALKVIEHYPALAKEWNDAEERKGHSFMPTPLKVLQGKQVVERVGSGCGCFGGEDNFAEELETQAH